MALQPSPIVLIGPAAVGKTTVGAALAARASRSFVDIDEVASSYYREVGQPVEALIAEIERRGLRDAHRWWQPARAHAAVRCIADHPDTVIAFGAGHSHFEDDEQVEVVAAALATATVVLLLPSPDPVTSLAVLSARCEAERGVDWGGHGFLDEWICSAHNARLADQVVYTEDRTPEEVVARVVAALT